MSGQYRTYPGTLYDYTAGVFCGVLVNEHVMRKLAALQADHIEKVKRLLTDNPDGVFPSAWTLHHPQGKQTVVRYIDESRTALQAIKGAAHVRQPEACFPVFVAGSMAEAEAMADARHAELSGTESDAHKGAA